MQGDYARVRQRCTAHILDHSDGPEKDAAIYTLSDPRDLQLVRYVGQTRAPRTRYLQHVNAAKLWLPDDLPWWIKSPQQRPLYHWIRDLYRDDSRLPVMVVVAWAEASHALAEERNHIGLCLQQKLPLLNREAEPRKPPRPRRPRKPGRRIPATQAGDR